MRNMRARRSASASQTTLHMEVDVADDDIEAEIDYVGKLSRQPGNLIVGAIAACRPEDKGFAAFLERQKSNPVVKGFRRVLHVMPDELSEGALFRENVKRLSGTGLTFDLCRPAAPDSRRRSRSSIWRPTCSSCSTIAACPTSRAVPSIPGAST